MKRRSFLALLGLAPIATVTSEAEPFAGPVKSTVPFENFEPDRGRFFNHDGRVVGTISTRGSVASFNTKPRA